MNNTGVRDGLFHDNINILNDYRSTTSRDDKITLDILLRHEQHCLQFVAVPHLPL